MKNAKRLLAVILVLAITVSGIAVNTLTTSARELDENCYEEYWGYECYIADYGWDNEAYRDYYEGTYNLDYYEKDLYAPFDPGNTLLEEGKTYKAIYYFKINKVNIELDWEVKCMPTEEYYFNITNADIWDGEGTTYTAVVVPFKVTDINNVKLKLWTHGALIEGSCLEKIEIWGADFDASELEFWEYNVIEGVANAGSNVEVNKPADDEWTPSDLDVTETPDEPVEPIDPNVGMDAIVCRPPLATANYVNIIGEDFYGSQASLGENVTKFDASIEEMLVNSFLHSTTEATEVVAGNQDNYILKWTGTMTADTSGEYTLIGRKIDNGFVMFVDGQKVYEYWGASHWFDAADDRVVSDLGSFEVVAGESYDVEIYFLEIGGGDNLEIWATTTPENTNSGANINEVFDFALIQETYWLADGGHWADYTNDVLVGSPLGEGNGTQCSEEASLFYASIEGLLETFTVVDVITVNSFADAIEAYESDTAYVVVYLGNMVPNVSGEYTFGADVIDNGFYLELMNEDGSYTTAYEFWVGRRWNDDGSGNTYYESVTLEAGVEYPFAAAFLETSGGQALELVASVDGGERTSVDELFSFSPMSSDDPEEPIVPPDIDNCSEIKLDEVKTAVVEEAGQIAYFSFTPEEDGYYAFYSMADEDTYGYILDADMNYLATDDDGGTDFNFKASSWMEAGTTYYLGASYLWSEMVGSFDVSVTKLVQATSMKIDGGDTVYGYVGSYDYLWVTFYPENAAEEEVSWSSSNPSVVSVDDWGDVEFLSEGTAIITATSENGLTDSIEVVVQEIPEVTLNVTQPVDINNAGDSKMFKFTPTETGTYQFRFENEEGVAFLIYTELGDWINNWYIYDNNTVKQMLEAGETYIIETNFADYEITGTYNFTITKSVGISKLEIVSLPTKMDYYEGVDWFEFAGLELKATLEDGTEVNWAYSDESYEMLAGFDVNIMSYDEEIFISCGGQEVSFSFNIVENPIESLEIVSGTAHTYVENYDGFWEEWYNEDTGEFEEFFYYSTYYPSDAVIRINYKDGTSITANVGDEVDGYAIGWNDYQYLHPWTVGTDNQSTVTYLGVTVNLPITVVETLIGDVNRDGVVNAKDVATLRRYLAGGWNVELG